MTEFANTPSPLLMAATVQGFAVIDVDDDEQHVGPVATAALRPEYQPAPSFVAALRILNVTAH